MKFSFYQVAQRFSIRKYSFGAASVLLGIFLLSGVQTAHADEQAGVSESTTSITSDNGVVTEKVTFSNAEIVLSEATVSVPKESLAPAEATSSAVTPEKASESSQHIEKVIAEFCLEWYAAKEDVMYAAMHYRNGEIPNESAIKATVDYTSYKKNQENAVPKFKYYSRLMSELKKTLDEEIKPLVNH